jgi:hypothetical protein
MNLRRSAGLAIILEAFILAGTAYCGAFDDAEEWGGYWRRYERPFGRRYEAPRTLYYGHAPPSNHIDTSPPIDGAPLYSTNPPTPDGTNVTPYNPTNYGRGRYYGPWLDPYYAPGRVSYGGYRYGWW